VLVLQWNAAEKCLGVERTLQCPAPRDVSMVMHGDGRRTQSGTTSAMQSQHSLGDPRSRHSKCFLRIVCAAAMLRLEAADCTMELERKRHSSRRVFCRLRDLLANLPASWPRHRTRLLMMMILSTLWALVLWLDTMLSSA
jgi:hypothetical protein